MKRHWPVVASALIIAVTVTCTRASPTGQLGLTVLLLMPIAAACWFVVGGVIERIRTSRRASAEVVIRPEPPRQQWGHPGKELSIFTDPVGLSRHIPDRWNGRPPVVEGVSDIGVLPCFTFGLPLADRSA